MRITKYLFPCLAFALFSCSQEDGMTQTDPVSKAMTVKTEITGSSRAMITDTRFPEGSSLGITVVENKDGVLSYDGLRMDIGISNTSPRANIPTRHGRQWTSPSICHRLTDGQ